MYLTNQTFYQTYLSSLPSAALFPLLQIVDRLLQTYGPYQLTHPEMLNILKQHAPTVFTLITLLMQHKKCSRKTVKILTRFVQTQSALEQTHFTITSPSEKVNTQLEKQLKKQFKESEFSLVSSDDIALQVKSGQLGYERSLKRDLKKIFSLS